MLIKDIRRFCDEILLKESIGLRDFKSEINGRWVTNTPTMYNITEYYKTNSKLKRIIDLNEFLDIPLALPIYVSEFWHDEYYNNNVKNEFRIVEETDDWELVTPFTVEASYYVSNKYLRQSGDEEQFGDGVSWCTAKKDDPSYWEKYTRGKEYPIVYILLSKNNSRDRYAIVFNNLHQTDDQKNRDIEFSKENFEKGYTIAKMNGEIRDFKQNISRKQNIADIERKFNVSLNTAIDKKSKRLNLSKVIYDNFDATNKAGEKVNKMSSEDKKISLTYKSWHSEGNSSFREKITTLFESVQLLKKELGLKYKKDYHPLTFDILVRKLANERYSSGFDYDAIPIFDIIKSDEDFAAFYSLFLFTWLLPKYDANSFNYIRNNILRSVVKNEKVGEEFVKNFKKCIEGNKYPRLLKASREAFNTNSHCRSSFFEAMRNTKNSIQGVSDLILNFYTLFEPSLMDFRNGFEEKTLVEMVDTFNNFKTPLIAFDLVSSVTDEKMMKYIANNYTIGTNGVIHSLEDTRLPTDFLLDGVHLEEIFRRNYFEISYWDSVPQLFKSIMELKKFLRRKTRPFVLEEWSGIKTFVDYHNALKNNFTSMIEEMDDVDTIIENAVSNIDDLMEDNGYSIMRLNLTNEIIHFYYVAGKK